MASDLQIQGEVVVNSEQAESAFNRVGDQASKMANKVADSAKKAGDEVDKIGDGADKGAEKFTRAESRISASIKRATNEIELLGKTASQRLEFNISDKGLDPKKFEPMLQRLREVEAQAEAAQRAATGSLDKMGISAKQTAAALRGVPAQFTDIITSLQGGQAPLTVFLQQGGQLKDMFGGAGNAARALSGYVVGLINPLNVAAGAAVALAFAYKQGSAEADGYRAALVTTGNAAGTNAAQLKAYALEISNVVGTQGKAAESLTALAATGKVGAESLRDAAQAAVQYERATGQAVSKTAEQFASLRNEPLAAVLKLNDGMNFLTDSTYKQIKSLEEQGKTAESANVAQRAFADTLSNRAGEMERNLGAVERGWLKVKDAAKGAWDAILNVGRASTSVDQLAQVRKQIAERENQIANAGFASNGGGAAFGRPSQVSTERLRAELAGLQAQAAQLEGVANQTRIAAEEERKRGEAVQATAAFDKAGEKYLTDKAKLERELAAARVQGAEAGKSQAEIEQRLAQIRESYAKKGGSSTAAENKELREQERLFAQLNGVSSTYYSELANAQKQRAAGVITEQQYVQRVEDLIQKQPFAVALAKEQADATKAQAKASEEATRAHIKYVESFGKGANAAQQQAEQLRTEEAAAALAADGYYSLAQAIELVTIARLEEQQQGLLGNEDAYLAVQKEIDARKELVTLIGSKEARKAAEDSARDAAKEWERSARDIERALTDSLLRGFESGKGFAKNFVDTMKNLFSTLVLRPVISAIVNPVAGALTGALGLAGPAAAAASGGGALGGASSLLSGVGALAGNFGAGLSTGFSQLLGGNVLGGLQLGGGLIGSGATAGGLGTIAGVLGPIALGIGALTAILNKTKGETRTGGQFGVAFDGSVTNQRRGQTYTMVGQQFDRDFTNGQNRALTNGQAYRLEGDPVAQESAIRDAVSGTARGINSFLEALGSSARLSGFSAGLETSGKGRGGVFAGGLFEDGTAFGESGKGDNYDQTLFERFSTNSPDFKQALSDFTLDLKQSTIQALQSVTDIPESIKKQLKDIDAEGLSEEAANALLESINAQIVGVNQFKSALDSMGMDDLAKLSFDAAAGLAEVSGGFDKLLGNLNTYYSNFFSPEEQRANVERQLQEEFAKLKIKLPDIDDKDARAKYRALVEAASKDMSEEGRKTYATLLSLSGAFAGVTNAAEAAASAVEDLAKAQADLRSAAFSALERAVAKEKEVLQAQIDIAQEVADTMGGLFDLLHDNVRELYGEVESTRGFQAQQGNDFIAQALAAARSTGYLPDADQLAEAIAGARSGFDSGNYSSQFEMDRDRLVLAGRLAGLEQIAGRQLTDAQRTVKELEGQTKQLDETLEYWQEQIDIANGTYEATLSVADAVKDLTKLMFPALKGDAAKNKPGVLGPSFGGGGAGGGNSSYVVEQLTSTVDPNSGTRNYSNGTSVQMSPEELYAWQLFQRPGFLPSFDVGTDYVPRDMLAMVHEGEKIVPKAYNPAANPGMSGGNGELVTAVNRLTEQNAAMASRLEAIERNTQLMPQMGRQFDTVSNGGTVLRNKALA